MICPQADNPAKVNSRERNIEYAIVYADGIYWENMRRIFVWDICEEEIDFRLHSIYNVFRRLVRTAEKLNDKG